MVTCSFHTSLPCGSTRVPWTLQQLQPRQRSLCTCVMLKWPFYVSSSKINFSHLSLHFPMSCAVLSAPAAVYGCSCLLWCSLAVSSLLQPLQRCSSIHLTCHSTLPYSSYNSVSCTLDVGMAYVLSLRPHSPLKRSFSDNPYLQSCSALEEPFLRPLGDVTARNTSACSLYTLSSNRSNIWNMRNENTPPLTSQSLLNLVPENQTYDFGSLHGDHVPRKRNCGVSRTTPSLPRAAAPANPFSRKAPDLQHVVESSSSSESSSESMDVNGSNIEESELFNLYEAIHMPLPEGRFPDNSGVEQHNIPTPAPETLPVETQPFRRWMSTLRRRHLHRRKNQELSFDGGEEVLAVRSPRSTDVNSVRRTSESMTSSMGFVTTVKTTSVTVASTSIAPTSERAAHKTTRFGNRSSNTDARRSIDSNRGGLGPMLDESAWLRSLQRRKVVEELVASEESYIADLKVLINVRQASVKLAPTR